jgi:hAT family C-terminal dimerisation region
MAEFANISIDPKTATKLSEIDDYLRLPVENVSDPLKWWYDNRRVYPNLSRMALDYLSIPGMRLVYFFD